MKNAHNYRAKAILMSALNQEHAANEWDLEDALSCLISLGEAGFEVTDISAFVSDAEITCINVEDDGQMIIEFTSILQYRAELVRGPSLSFPDTEDMLSIAGTTMFSGSMVLSGNRRGEESLRGILHTIISGGLDGAFKSLVSNN